MRPAFVAAALAVALPVPAAAQAGVEVSANAAVVSDYRFRGLSLSDRDPAVQGGIDLEAGPFFAGAWASTIADYGGATAELDVYAGLQGDLAGLSWRGGAYAYLYPGGHGVDYLELAAGVERSFGPATLALEAALTPRQDNVTAANHYLGASGEFDAGGGWSLTVRGGYEDGFYDGKWDWEAGAGYTVGQITASLAYVDTNYSSATEAGRLGAAGLVASLAAEF